MKTVIFDMDGVLFDTEKLCMDGWSVVAKEEGIEDMEKVSLRCIGLNSNDTRALVLNHYGQDFPYDKFRERTSVWVREHIETEGVPVKPGVRELLAFMKEAGFRIGLASSTKRETVINHLTSTGIRDYFSVIVTGDMVEHSKPKPDIYLLACEEMNVNPREAYAIEDSPNGIRAAHAAGMKPIMVPDLIGPDEEMRNLSFRIFENLLEVKGYFEKESKWQI